MFRTETSTPKLFPLGQTEETHTIPNKNDCWNCFSIAMSDSGIKNEAPSFDSSVFSESPGRIPLGCMAPKDETVTSTDDSFLSDKSEKKTAAVKGSANKSQIRARSATPVGGKSRTGLPKGSEEYVIHRGDSRQA